MKRYWTADLHFGHKKIAELRGYDSVEEHDQAIISIFNDVVNPSDIVYILGDLSMGQWTETLAKAQQLHGKKRLISGNHDATWPLNKSWHKHLASTLQVFESVTSWDQTSINGTKVLMSHLPYKRDSITDDRYMNVRLESDMPLLCGHVHDQWAYRNGMINVGWDIWKEPISEAMLTGILEANDSQSV